MRGTQSSLKFVPALASETGCPKCGTSMRLSHIVPGKPGYDVRTLACRSCGESVTNTVKI
jgi:hypothetical protein